MKIGFVGLGKMGKGLVTRLLAAGIEVVAYNRTEATTDEVVLLGALKATSISDMVAKLDNKKVIWLMLPAGQVTREVAEQIAGQLNKGDVIIDGANSNYKNTLLLEKSLKQRGISLIDVGVSGGPTGAKNGACLMIGGEKRIVDELWLIFKALSAKDALLYCGPTGAGHFVKMVHNGIEYGMMQAIAEGAAVLKASDFNLDLAKVFRLYNLRSVIESRLVGWAQSALEKDPDLKNISAKIEASGEGEWTVEAAKTLGIEVPVIEKSLQVRRDSQSEAPSFRNKIVSALRGEFGGHQVKI